MLLLSGCLFANAQQALRLPRFFADGMVLQRDAKNPVWGWSRPGEVVRVEFNGQVVKTEVMSDGTWKVYLPKMKASSKGGVLRVNSYREDNGTITMRNGNGSSVKVNYGNAPEDSECVTISNVLIGDVFLCSGQSNMELPIRRCMDVVADKVKDYSNPNIRYLKLPHQYNYNHPNEDVIIKPWQDITPENCAEVSGICYFMARELQEAENVPIGIINSAVGGTRVEAWTPQNVLAQFPAYKDEFKKQKYTQVNWTDSIARMENRRGMEWENNAMKTDTVLGKWKNEGYDFSSWKTTDIFGKWFDGNGSYWFRKMVSVPADLAGKEATIRIGAMKDADSVFVNGKFIGNTTYEYPPRIYKIPAGLLKAGENEVMVHLISQSGRGNFTKGKLYQLEIGERIIPLGDEWQYAQGSKMQPKPGSTYFVDGNTGLYNAMIAPFKDIQLKGILWYQGESNLGNTKDYALYLEAMIGAWRKQLGKDYPFVIMQLPGYQSKHDKPFESGWTQIREQQYIAAKNIKNAGLAPTLDTGEYNDIHPQDKATAGHRAALQMEKLAYKRKGVSTGPQPVSAVVKNGKLVVTFSKETGKLTCKGDKLNDFAILVDGKYQWANATIVSDYVLSVDIPEGLNTTTLRYCWDDYPTPTLYNADGIPAPQFEISSK